MALQQMARPAAVSALPDAHAMALRKIKSQKI
jgi:hypothetical protein